MKTRLALTLATLLPVPALAGPPVPFDNWTVNGGRISAGCPSGYTCEENVNDRGITQRILTDTNGRRYIQLIIHDQNARGSLSIESFVSATENAPQDGIAIKQVMSTGDGKGGTLDATALINTGWAIDPTQPALRLQQRLLSPDGQGGTLTSDFDYQVFSPTGSDGGQITGVNLDLRQDLVTPSQSGNSQDFNVFVLRRIGGDQLQQSGSVTLPGRSGMGGMGGMGMRSGRGGTMSWQAGDTVQAIWVGQQCEGCQSGGMGGMGGMGGGGGGLVTFSYQAFDNLSDSTGEITSYSLSTPNPFSWADPPFGPTPALQ